MRGSHVDKSKAALSLESKIFPPARKDFANLYQDDRIYFADGFSQNVENIPSDDSPSLDKLNQHGNNVFKRHELESILEESILKNEAFRNSKNMYLLIFASQWIRSQSSISADDLRSELVIHRKLFEWTEKAHDYGSLFKLTNSERNTLMGVSPDKSEYASQSTGETRYTIIIAFPITVLNTRCYTTNMAGRNLISFTVISPPMHVWFQCSSSIW